MQIDLEGRLFSVRSHTFPWGYLRTRTVLHVAAQAGTCASDDGLESFLVEHQERLGVNCLPGNRPDTKWPVMVVTSRNGRPLDELAITLLRELESAGR